MQPTAASQAFESGADDIRARAVELVRELSPLGIRANIGESQRFRRDATLQPGTAAFVPGLMRHRFIARLSH